MSGVLFIDSASLISLSKALIAQEGFYGNSKVENITNSTADSISRVAYNLNSLLNRMMQSAGYDSIYITDTIKIEASSGSSVYVDSLVLKEYIATYNPGVVETGIGTGKDNGERSIDKGAEMLTEDPAVDTTKIGVLTDDTSYNFANVERITTVNSLNSSLKNGYVSAEEYAQIASGIRQNRPGLNGIKKLISNDTLEVKYGLNVDSGKYEYVPSENVPDNVIPSSDNSKIESGDLSEAERNFKSLSGDTSGRVGLGGALALFGVAIVAYDIYSSTVTAMRQAESGNVNAAIQTMIDLGGRLAGGWAGAEMGSAIGSLAGPVGAVAGGFIGGAIGAYIGNEAAEGKTGTEIAQDLAAIADGALNAAVNAIASFIGTTVDVIISIVEDPRHAANVAGNYIQQAAIGLKQAVLDPLVMDVSGAGLSFINEENSHVYFDFSGTELAQKTSWIGTGTGFLAISESDGSVSNGNDLITSFEQLAAFDANNDGVINGSELNGIVVWQDENNDGLSQADEVESLTDLGVESISLQTEVVSQIIGDVSIVKTAIATMGDGTTREIAAADFNVSNILTQYVGDNNVTSIIEDLPDLKGYGVLPDLQISMSNDDSIEELVQTLLEINNVNISDYDAALQAVLYRWAGVDGINPESGGAFDGQKLVFLQKILGNNELFGVIQQYSTPFFVGQSNLLQKSWNEIFSALKARVLVQTSGSVFESNFSFDVAGDVIIPRVSFSDAISSLNILAPDSVVENIAYWSNVILVISSSVSDISQYAALDINSIELALQSVVPGFFSPAILLAAASGQLNFVEGWELNADFSGTTASDLMQVTEVNSNINGLGGNDEFIIGEGLGATEINEADNADDPDNVILLNNINPSGVIVSGNATGGIVLTLSDGSRVILDNMLVRPDASWEQAEGHDSIALGSQTAYGVQRVLFTDGTIWTSAELIEKALTGTVGADHLYGTDGADTLDGLGGGDTLQGNGGGDTFIYNEGYGALEINEMDAATTPDNTLSLGSALIPSQMRLGADSAGNVILTDGITGDRIQIDGMLLSTKDGVQSVVFADGTSWSAQYIRQVLTTGSSDNTTLVDTQGEITLNPNGYAHLVKTNGGNDTILFNAGYGAVEINQRDGNSADINVLQFGEGIAPGDIAVHGDGKGNIILTVGANGDQIQLDGMLLSSSNGVQRIQFADGTIWSAANLIAQVPSSEVSGSNYYQVISFAENAGAVAAQVYGNGEVDLPAGITADDVYFQVNATGDLILKLRDNAASSLTLENDLYGSSSDLTSHISKLVFSDGSILDLSNGVTATWIGTATNHVLTGASGATNVFELGTGGDQVTVVNDDNVFVFGKGDGHSTVTLNGHTGTVQMAAGIAASDVGLEATSAGDLIVQILDTGETITFQKDLTGGYFGVSSQVSLISFADGSSINLSSNLGPSFTWIGTGSGVPILGSNYGSNTFIVGPNDAIITAGNGSDPDSGGGNQNNASKQNTFIFDKGDGHATVDMNGGIGTLTLGADISASDVLVQADNAGNLTVALRGDPNDTITFTHDLSAGYFGVSSALTSITLGDGSSIDLTLAQGPVFTWVGTSTNTVLVGSNYGPNTFILGAGGDQVTAGNGDNPQSYGGNQVNASKQNTFVFDKGDGHATVDMNGGVGTLTLGADISAADVLVQADNTGDLTVALRGDPDDTITFTHDLSAGYFGVSSALTAINLSDGSSIDLTLAQGPVFTWVGTSTNTVLVGSNYGPNTFILGAGGDQVTAGNGNNPQSYGGNQVNASKQNTFVFDKGDGHATVDMNGGVGTLTLGADISAADVLVQADNAGDLTVALRGDPDDTITFSHDLSAGYFGVSSALTAINLSDGSSINLTSGLGLAFTWVGTVTNTVLVGSNYGSNTFILGTGGDQVTAGNGTDPASDGSNQNNASKQNTFVFDKGDGHATVNMNGGVGTLTLGADISAADVLVQADNAGDLTVALRGDPDDTITFTHDLSAGYFGVSSALTAINLSDGSSINLTSASGPAFTWVGTATNTVLVGSNYGPNTFILGAGGDQVTAGNGSAPDSNGNNQNNASKQNTVFFDVGDGAASINMNYSNVTIVFGGGIDIDDLSVGTDSAGHEVVSVGSQGDQITFTNVSSVPLLDVIYNGQELAAQIGHSGTSSLTGGSQADLFDSRGIATYEQGNGGGDTFIVNAGYGSLEINESGNGLNTLQLGSGINPADIVVSNNGSDVYLTDAVSGNTIRLDAEMNGTGRGVGQVIFADGTIWTQSQIEIMAMTGTSGNNNIYGTTGADIIDGKGGNDYVEGGGGGDTFIVNAGYGSLEINESGNGLNVLQLGSGINPADVVVTDNGSNVYLTDTTSGITVRLDSEMNGAGRGVEQVVFADGTVWTQSQIEAMAMIGTSANNNIYGTSGADIIDGKGGNDYVEGSGGGDTFIANAGYGSLEINESGSGLNVLQLGSGINPSDIVVTDNGSDVYLTDTTSGITVRLDGEMNGTGRGVGQVVFADGTIWTQSQIEAMALTGTSGNNNIYGTSGADVIDGKGGNDYENGNGGGDTFIANAGYDTLEIDESGSSLNVLLLGSGIVPGDLVISQNGSDIYLTDSASGNIIRLDSEMNGTGRGVGQVVFADGTIWTQSQIEAMAMIGTSGNNNIYGTSGADVIDGKGGNDYENGKGGGDTFIANAGYGTLEIDESGNGLNVLQLGSGINPGDIGVSQSGSDVYLTDTVSGNTIRLDGEMNGAGRGVEQVIFADGTVWTQSQIASMLGVSLNQTNIINGTTNGDSLSGTSDPDVIDGKGGSDYERGNGGGDTFIANAGYGALEIDESGSGLNVLQLGSGINPEDIVVTQNGSDIYLTDTASGNTIRLDGEEDGTGRGVEQVIFADGTVWTQAELITMVLTGTTANNNIYGTSGADIIDGKGGNDFERGYGGGDTFIANAGYGQLEIDESGNGLNVLQLGSGINPGDIVVGQNSSDIYLTDTTSGNTIRLDGEEDGIGRGVEQVIFSDGTVWTQAELIAMILTGTTANNNIYGTSGADIIDGKGGNDFERGYGGGDTFIANAGYGQLEIDESGNGLNVLQLGSGINPGDIVVTQNGSDIYLTDTTSGNTIRLDGEESGTGRGVEQVIFANGTVWTQTQLIAMVLTGTAGNNTIYGTSGADVIDGKGGNDYEEGAGGGDTFIVNADYGSLEINESGSGLNTLQLGSGIDAADVGVSDNNNGDVYLTDAISGNTIRLDGELNGTGRGVEQVVFADGTIWTQAQIEAKATTGTAGADSIYGTSGADIIDGKGGSDYEKGNGGGDTFIANAGYGQFEIDESGSGLNVLQFGSGINAADVSVSKSGNGIILTDTVSEITVSLDNEMNGVGQGVEEVHFADGLIWSQSQMMFMAQDTSLKTIAGTLADDVLQSNGSNNTLVGGGGDDTYLVHAGSGSLTIENGGGANTAPAGQLMLGNGLAENTLWFSQSNDDLLIQLLGSSDVIDIKGWFGADPSAQLSRIVGSDGLQLEGGVTSLVTAMASYQADNPSFNVSTATTLPSDAALQASLASSWHA